MRELPPKVAAQGGGESLQVGGPALLAGALRGVSSHGDQQTRNDPIHMDGAWRAGVTHAGRWCDVFEVRDFLIQRCLIYLDPDYAGLDTVRYPWLAAGARDPSKPMGS